jgi:hypothetical protein
MHRLRDAWINFAPSAALGVFRLFWWSLIASCFYMGGLNFALGFGLCLVLSARVCAEVQR